MSTLKLITHIVIMKYILFTLLFFVAFYADAQIIDKDTIQLHNIVISNKKPKIKKIKIKSPACLSHENLLYTSQVITLIDKLPSGYLHSVTFNFNNFMESDVFFDLEKYPIIKEDTNLEVLFYDVNLNGTPGKPLAYNKSFIVKKDFEGEMTIDLRLLYIKTNGKFFIGLKRYVQPPGYFRSFEVDFCCHTTKYTSYIRKTDNDSWVKNERDSSAAPKMTVKVAVYK